MSEDNNNDNDNDDNAASYDDAWWENVQREAEEKRRTAAARLKSTCGPLAKLGVVIVTWLYDGSGDSGDIDRADYATETGVLDDKALSAAIKTQLSPEEQALLNSDTLKETVLTLLPGGFEINDGSYGEVTLDVATSTITIAHNERYTDSTYSEEEL